MLVPKRGTQIIGLRSTFAAKQLTGHQLSSDEVCCVQANAHDVPSFSKGSLVFTVEVRYLKAGMVAMNLKAETLALARAKAKHMKSQAFHVEIKNADGQTFPLNGEE